MEKREIEARITNTVERMTKGILVEDVNEKVKAQIERALDINHNYTSTYALENVTAEDIHGKDSKTSGWYIILEGTKVSVKFFLNNDMEITRKPRNVETKATYNFRIEESFFKENF